MVHALKEHFGPLFEFERPDGSYHLWAKLHVNVSDRALVETTLRHGVVILPGTVFGADPGFVRLTYACASDSQIVEGIRRLKNAVASLQGRK